jgi:squalene-hopene/tetraprenyl-beta-curcumene cyclase
MRRTLALIISGVTLVTLTWFAPAEEPKSAPSAAELKAVTDKAIAYLRAHQDEDGSWSKKLGGPGVTALVTAALVRSGHGEDPMVAKALKYLESSAKPDGGIYDRGLANYTTSVAVMAFQDANQGGKYDTVIKNAANFLKGLQYDEQKGVETSNAAYGGAGYDGKSRPDLSNTQFFIQALKAAGLPKDDPAMKRALVFISRSQNLPGEHNELEFAKKTSADDKGGFIYTPVSGGQSNAGKTDDGGLRSAGVMTYAGLLSFLYAGVDQKDPRVQAAIEWIKNHYSLDENPGQGQTGLFYYYHTFGKAMAALNASDEFTDAKGGKHNWKRDLFEALKKRQNAEGTWSNASDRFYEGDGNLCAAYSLLALSYCKSR